MSEANERNRKIIDEFRPNGGKVGGRFEGRMLLLLHTKGAKSGRERINPLATVKDGDRYIVIASNGGSPTHPDWYFNVLANPVSLWKQARKHTRRAPVSRKNPERTRLYNKMVEMMPLFDEYRRKTQRELPVIVLERTS